MKKLTVLILVLMGVLFATSCQLLGQIHQVPLNKMHSVQAAELYNEAAIALRMRRLTEARARLEKILRDYPEDFYAPMARRLLVEILRDTGEYEQAIAMLKEILAKTKSDTSEYFVARKALLDIFYELQRFREGIELLEEWRRQKPNDLYINRQLARFYLQTGRKEEAWMLLETQFERSGDRLLFNDLLDIALKSGEVEKLIKTLDDRRSRFTSADYSRYMTDCYLALGMKEKAIEVLRQNPDIQRDFQLLEKLADLLIDTGKIEEALQILQKVDQMVPNNWNTLKKMGHCLFLLKRPNQAIEVWRRPFRSQHLRQEQYMNYTTVLIEHQLYEEALDGFYEARKKFGHNTLFAEEVATVLEALGRKNEALEEYIQVLSTGAFRLDVFNKLYESDKTSFNLEKRLRDQLPNSKTLALRQALIELYFRRPQPNSIVKIVEIVLDTDNLLDNFIVERLKQDASVYASNFHFDLCRSLIAACPHSTLALRLARMMLNMARLEPILAETAYKEALDVSRSSTTVDAELKAQLLLDLADFAFKIRREPKTAIGLLDMILQSDLLKAVGAKGVKAALYRAHIMICQKDYQRAQSLLDEIEKQVSAAARKDIFVFNSIDKADFFAQIKLERAFLELNQYNFQKALDLLKDIVENLPETIWTNDALEMAMFVTRTSVGDFSLLKNLLRARRLASVGRSEEAAKQYTEIIKANPSLSALITEIEAEAILEASRHLTDEQLLNKITKFTNDNPNNFLTADLYEKELYLLRKKKATEAEIRGLMQKFIDQFPDDIRSGRFKKLIENKQLIVLPPSQEVIKVVAPPRSVDQPPLLDDGRDVNLDKIVPQAEFIDIDEMGDY